MPNALVMLKQTLFCFFLLLVFSLSVHAQGNSFPPGAGSGAVVACIGTPGNTTAAYRQQCQTTGGAVYACNNAAGCTLAADWSAIGGSGGTCSALGGDVTGTCTANVVSTIGGIAPAKVATTGNYNDLLNQPTQTSIAPGLSPNQTTGGCTIEGFSSGLTVTLSQCSYQIAGVNYNISTPTSKTLATADPTNPRFDLIGVDNTGSVFVTTGTPAVNPAVPAPDAGTQLGLFSMEVAAGATSISNLSVTTIYDENTEWTCASSANINCASTNNPYHGTKDIEATNAVLGNNFTLVKPASGTVNLSTLNNLVCYIRSKGQWPTGTSGGNAARYLSLFWENGTTQIGNQIVVRDGTFGFSSAVTTNYQQLGIPLSVFGTQSNLVTTLKALVSGPTGSANFGWYIDECSIQGGATPAPLPTTLMNFKGVYSSTTAYNANDTVISNGIAYVALVANVNIALNTANTWAPLSTPSDVHIIPFANCIAGSAGGGANTAASNFSAQCRGGTNNLGGVDQAVPSAGASLQFMVELPADWNSAAQAFINVYYGSGTNTSGTVIWTASSACVDVSTPGGASDDPSFHAESAFATQTMANANRMWDVGGQFTAMTSGNGCKALSAVIIKLAVSGTAGANINAYHAVVTIPRYPVVQAN